MTDAVSRDSQLLLEAQLLIRFAVILISPQRKFKTPPAAQRGWKLRVLRTFPQLRVDIVLAQKRRSSELLAELAVQHLWPLKPVAA